MRCIIVVILLVWTTTSHSTHGVVVAFLAPSRATPRRSAHREATISVEEPEHEFESILSVEETRLIEELIEERSRARWDGNYTHADIIRDKISCLELPDNWQVVVTDIPRKQGGGSTWKLVETKEDLPILEGATILQLAHSALGLAAESSVQANLGRAHTAIGMQEKSYLEDNKQNERLNSIVKQAHARFQNPNWSDTELAGRKAADAAFWFALSGVTDRVVFETLAHVATRELDRFGARSSCRAKDIYQIMERFSAAGVEGATKLEEAAKTALVSKGDVSNGDALLEFHSDRSLLLIWKFSTKQKKQRAFLQSALKHWQRQKGIAEAKDNIDSDFAKTANSQMNNVHDWNSMFKDPLRPLVVDVGCGMGVSLLGLASGNNPISSQVLLGDESHRLEWKDCNFVGVDLGGLGIGYARGLASRWGLDDRLQFVIESAEGCLQSLVQRYPGPIKLCLIQFPTPYVLNKTSSDGEKTGNSQLPISARDGFMVTEELLQLAYQALSKSNGKLLLQSNCEDVAVHMHNLAAKKVGFEVEYTDQTLLKIMSKSYGSPGVTPRVPQRTADWIAMGGQRAEGADWSVGPILHRESATETEVACALNGTPVHRCVLRAITRES